jgi:hypothetical protein
MLVSSRRSLNKVTYAPVRPDDADVESGAILKRKRTLETAAMVRALHVSERETAELKARAADDPGLTAAAEAMGSLAAAAPSRAGSTIWTALAQVPQEDVVRVGRELAALRRTHRTNLVRAARELVAAYEAAVPEAPPTYGSLVPLVSRTTEPVTSLGPSALAAGLETAGLRPLRTAIVVEAPRPSTPTRPRGVRPGLLEALQWARDSAPARAEALGRLATLYRRDVGLIWPADLDSFIVDEVGESQDEPDWTDELIDGFEESMRVEPIGRLHLERIDMTPVTVVRGELMHSVPLAPGESVSLIHREWSSRTTEFEKVVSEEFEQSTEEGVTENTDLSSATESQSRHSKSLNMEATASASYGIASGSVTIGYGTTSDDETAKKDSRNHAIGVTRKASARTRQEHKVTFTVKQEAGVEDESVRTLVNHSTTEPLRVDYHQLMRKWQVDLYRHGLRLTYDIVVPSPGIDLLAQLDRLRELDLSLGSTFEFPLLPSQVTPGNWQTLAARHGADVEPPPRQTERLFAQRNFAAASPEAAPLEYQTFDFEIPADYRVRRGEFVGFFSFYGNGLFEVMMDRAPGIEEDGDAEVEANQHYGSGLEHLIGAQGTVAVIMLLHRVRAGHAQAALEVELTPEALAAWQGRAWAALRRAALEQWQARREQAQAERDRLAAEVAKWDALSLRRLEREELMKTVLKWIFGPEFDLMAGSVRRLFDTSGDVATVEPSRLSEEQWARVMGAGEFIKFLHQAIEWENVLAFPYPYFWDHPKNHYHKRFLHHPDSLYRAFLRAGAARVVLPVRPGFEESFTRLFEAGGFDAALDDDHPYLTIAQEIGNFAATRYTGIPSSEGDAGADPEASEAPERGVRIATWYEYTPLSALDITVNTPLVEMA